MRLDKGVDLVDNAGDLGAGGADEGVLIGKRGVEGGAVEGEAGIVGKPLDEVLLAAVFAHVEGDGDGVFLDYLVAVSRPTPARTAAMRILVVARKGR